MCRCDASAEMLTADSPWAHVKLDGWQVRGITSHVTRNTSYVTHHTSHVTRHTSHVTRRTSHVTLHTSHVTRHTSHITHRSSFTLPTRTTCQEFRRRHRKHAVTSYSGDRTRVGFIHCDVTRHTSRVTRHTSRLTRVSSCIVRDPAQRWTAAQLLHHPWMSKR